MDDILLTPKDVAERLQISVGYAYSLLKKGEIPAIRFGTTVRVRREDLDEYLRLRMLGKDLKGGNQR